MYGRLLAAALAWIGLVAAASAGVRADDTAFLYTVRSDHWSPADERAYSGFIAAIGNSQCRTVDSCLHGAGNPFAASDAADFTFHADCAEFAYVLRAYFAWKRSLPFSYASEIDPRSRTDDIRYTRDGNEVSQRADAPRNAISGYALLNLVREAVSSANFRIGADHETPFEPDIYSPAVAPGSIRPGTMVYDPNGHVAIVYRVDPNGRLEYMDAHPDESVTHGIYDARFARALPAMGAGFKNWRPMQLVDATLRPGGVYVGGHVVLAANRDIPDFSDEQYYGTGKKPADDADWNKGGFSLNGQTLDYYDFVRARMAGGKLEFDPVAEIRDMVAANCNDLRDRGDAVAAALAAGIAKEAEPERLPINIFGADGDWETYASPSRDTRLRAAFKDLRDRIERFVTLYRAHDPRLVYRGNDLVADLIAAYGEQAAACKLSYARSDGTTVAMSYEDARRRLFRMSFDPYQCAERRWGAIAADELSTCRDDAGKRAWYAAEQKLRNAPERDYDSREALTLDELKRASPGAAIPPDTDALGYLMSMRGRIPPTIDISTPSE